MERYKLFVGNLNFDVTEDEVKKLFSPYGVVKSVRFRNKKGCALVEMSDPVEAESAIKDLDKKCFRGRRLRIVNELSSKKERSAARRESAGRLRILTRVRELISSGYSADYGSMNKRSSENGDDI